MVPLTSRCPSSSRPVSPASTEALCETHIRTYTCTRVYTDAHSHRGSMIESAEMRIDYLSAAWEWLIYRATCVPAWFTRERLIRANWVPLMRVIYHSVNTLLSTITRKPWKWTVKNQQILLEFVQAWNGKLRKPWMVRLSLLLDI